MSRQDGEIIAFDVGGKTVLVEGVEFERRVPVRAGSDAAEEEMVGIGDAIADQFDGSFENALEKIKPAAEQLISSLQDFVEEPEEIEVSFGIKMNASFGALIASGKAEGHFNVKMKWKKSDA
ncbi:MAG: CU044_2847 family protein [Pseudomonadota bacterium]